MVSIKNKLMLIKIGLLILDDSYYIKVLLLIGRPLLVNIIFSLK